MARVENTCGEVNADTPQRCSYASIADLRPLVYHTEHTARATWEFFPTGCAFLRETVIVGLLPHLAKA
jgi:hypothetical protein